MAADIIQAGIVASFKRGAWTAHVIDRNCPERNHGVSESCRYMIRLDHPNGFHTDWPVRYDNGTFGFDTEPTRDGLRATKAAYKKITQLIA